MTSPAVVVFGESDVCARYLGAEWSGSVGDRGPVRTSVFDLIDDDVVAVAGGMIPTIDVVADVVRTAVEGAGGAVPADVVVVPYPTRWGAPRREALVSALHRVAVEAVVVQNAVAIARADDTGPARVVVVEATALSLTVSYLVADSVTSSNATGYRVVACEYEPNIGGHNDGSAGAAANMIGAVSDHRAVDRIWIAGPCDAAQIASAVAGRFAITQPKVSVVDERELARALEVSYSPRTTDARNGRTVQPPITRMPPSAWLEPAMRSRARASSRRRPILLAAAAAMVVAAAVVAVALVRSDPPASVEAAPVRELPPSSAPVSSAVAPEPDRDIQAGRVRVRVPDGWRERPAADTAPPRETRLELIPGGGTDRRVIVMQNSLRQGADYDAVAATLSTKIAGPDKRARFSDLERGPLVDGREGIAYVEQSDENSQVKWSVLVQDDVQVSVGCQYLSAEWDAVRDDCRRIVSSVEIVA